MEDDLLSAAFHPREALGSRRGSLAVPLLVRVPVGVECYCAEHEQDLKITVDAVALSSALFVAVALAAVDDNATLASNTADAAKKGGAATIADAMMRMVEILLELKPRKNPTGLDQAIGGLGSDASSSSTAQPSGRIAVARLASRNADRDQPKHLSSRIFPAVLDSLA